MVNNKYSVLVGIVLISLFFKIIYVVCFSQLPMPPDAVGYDNIGWNIAQGKAYSDNVPVATIRGPVYPGFLAAIFSIFGHNYLAVRIVQSIVSSLLVVVVYWITCRITNEKTALLASLLVAFYPAFTFYSGILLSETLSTFLLAISLMFLFQTIKYKSVLWAVTAGCGMGVCILCRSEMLLFPFFLIILLPCLKKGNNIKKENVKLYSIFLLATILIITPWIIRNYVVFHKFMPVSAGGKASLWLASHPDDLVEWDFDSEPLKSLSVGVDLDKADTWIKLDEILFKEGIKNITLHPFIYIKLSAKRFFRFWVASHSNKLAGLHYSFNQSIQLHYYKVFLLKIILLIINIGLLIIGLVGFFIEKKSWRLFLPVILLIIYKTIFHMAFPATPRYQIPVMPFVLIFSAIGIVRIIEISIAKRKNLRIL